MPTNDERARTSFDRVLLELGYTDADGEVATVLSSGRPTYYLVCGEGTSGMCHVREKDVHFYIRTIRHKQIADHFYVELDGNLRKGMYFMPKVI
jgi:hypothetical protein